MFSSPILQKLNITLRKFSRDEKGSFALLFGVSAVVVVGLAGAAIDFGQQQLARQKLWQAASLTCQYARKTSAVNTTSSAQTAIKDFFNGNLNSQNIPASSVAPNFVTTSNGPATVSASYNMPTAFLGLFNIPTLSVSVAQQCYAVPPALVAGTEVFKETFEAPATTGTITRDCGADCFRFVQGFNGWTTVGDSGGLEISDGYKAGAPEGNRVGELVPDRNLAISKKIPLAAGTYELRYFYIGGPNIPLPEYYGSTSVGPATFNNDPLPLCAHVAADVSWATSDNSRIGVYLSADQPNFEANYLTGAIQPTSQNWRPADLLDVCIYSRGWIERSVSITVAATGDYWITFAAQGAGAAFEGAQLDNIRLCYVACTGARQLAPSETQGHVLLEENFESPVASPSPFLNSLRNNGWITTQYDSIQLFPFIDAPEGRQYLELDANSNYIGTSTATINPNSPNRTISRRVLLAQGPYQLAYWYKSRIPFGIPTHCGPTAAAAQSGYPTGTARSQPYYPIPDPTSVNYYNYNTNRLGVYLDSELTTTSSERPGFPLEICMNQDNWAKRYVTFRITKPRWYWLAFQAEGTADVFGALVDDIRLCAINCPDGPTNQTPISIAP